MHCCYWLSCLVVMEHQDSPLLISLLGKSCDSHASFLSRPRGGLLLSSSGRPDCRNSYCPHSSRKTDGTIPAPPKINAKNKKTTIHF